ncbi:MAG: WD40 repeat domain-containing protein [Promethearchaeota archaeon]
MNINKNYIKVILIITLLGIFTTGTYIGFNLGPNISWSYYLTNNFEEQNSHTAISANGEYLVIGSQNDRLYLFHRKSSKPLWIWSSTGDVHDVDISADSNYIIAGGLNGIARLFERNSSIAIWNFTTDVSSVAISSDGEYTALSAGFKLYLYQRSNSTLLINGTNAGSNVAISSDGNYIAASNLMWGEVYLFNKSSSTPMWQYNIGDILRDIAIAPNGEFIVTGGQASSPFGCELYLFYKSSSIPQIIYTDGSIRVIDISQDGDYIAVGCDDGIYLFNSSSLTRLWKYSFPENGDTHTIAISDDGEYIVANLWRDPLDGKIDHLLIFNKMSNRTIETLEMESMVNEVAISSNGNHISVATQQRAYYINLKNPNIDPYLQIKSIISFSVLGSFVGFGIFGTLIYIFKLRKKNL